MAAITPDLIEAMRDRRAAGERVSTLAGALGVTWQKLEKLTRRATQPLPNDPQRLKQELRWTRLMLVSVPSLGCDKPWARAWRERICRRLRERMVQLRRRLSHWDRSQQVPVKAPKLWKPRPSSPADARISRQFDPEKTTCLWSEAQ